MIKLAVDTIDRSDINALCNWLHQDPIPQLTQGELTVRFEQEWAQKMGCKYAVFVNSGSSANLLAVYSLIVSKRLKNNKVVVPAVSWITSIAPILQFGLEPILIDCDMKDLSVNVNKLEDIFKKENPAAFVVVPILGLVPDMSDIRILCLNYRVELIVDNCESLGSKYKGWNLEKFGLLSTCSMYFGHHLSCVEGGVISTNDDELYKILKALRSHGWSRNWREDERGKEKYKWGISDDEELYTFYYPGFNLRNTSISAFLALRQLDKMDDIVRKRNKNYELFNEKVENNYWKPEISEFKYVSNLGYPIITDKRTTLMNKLRENNIECRPLVSGSMGRQPFWIERYGRMELFNASVVHTAGLYVPNHAHLSYTDISFIAKIVNSVTCA